jgi:ABC-2 type transport system permease protein
MTLWRLELLRVLRTRRWLLLVGVYVFFAILGPVTARYMDVLLQQVGGEMTVILPDPRPIDGMIQFVSNVAQLGLLAVVVVAAGSLAFDGHPERAAFLRTRMPRPGMLVLPPYAVVVATAVVALLLATAVALVLTGTLLGSLPLGTVAIGTLLGALYLAFAIAVVAAVAGFVRSQVATVFASLGALLVLPMLAMIESVRPWSPSELLTAVLGLLEGAGAGDYGRAVVITVLATAGLVWLAVERVDRREL